MIKFIVIALIIALVGFLLDMVNKPLMERYAEKKVNKMLSDMKDGKVKEVSFEDRRYGIIEIRNDGFQIRRLGGKDNTNVAWNDVSEIFAYKKDLVTTDLICLGWKLIRTNEIVETQEEMPGFKKLCDAMLSNFETIPVTWHMDVALPAFKTNLTLLWSKTKGIANEETIKKN